jgi:soluble lytic murein transglycosylase-like protein
MLGTVALAAAQDASAPEPGRRITSVVRADPRSGRLVRSVVVTPRVVAPIAVPARPVPAVNPPRPQPATEPAPVAAELPPLAPAFGLPKLVDEISRLYKVDPLLVHSVIQVESNYNPLAVSPKGAQGIMQLIPSTARRFGVRDTFDVKQNIKGGVMYLKYLQTLFSDTRHVLAAYNAGEEAVIKFGGIPPYPETRNYVYQVGRRLGQLRAVERSQSETQAQQEPPQETKPRIEQFTDASGVVHYVTK